MVPDQLFANSNFLLLGLNAGLLFMQVLLFATSLFLMLLILVQRGKGGGLTGALGGMGGQSAFGSKAGDAFTKITVITAMIWITLCMVTIAAYNPPPRTADKQQLDEPTTTLTGDAADETEGSTSSGDESGSASSEPLQGDNESAEAEASEADTEFKLDLEGPGGGPANPPSTDDGKNDSGQSATNANSSEAGSKSDGN